MRLLLFVKSDKILDKNIINATGLSGLCVSSHLNSCISS